jgi:hypothetical protein
MFKLYGANVTVEIWTSRDSAQKCITKCYNYKCIIPASLTMQLKDLKQVDVITSSQNLLFFMSKGLRLRRSNINRAGSITHFLLIGLNVQDPIHKQITNFI